MTAFLAAYLCNPTDYSPYTNSIPKKEAAYISEMLVLTYKTTQFYNPEDQILNNHLRENLKTAIPC
jgi:hypothetical protein